MPRLKKEALELNKRNLIMPFDENFSVEGFDSSKLTFVYRYVTYMIDALSKANDYQDTVREAGKAVNQDILGHPHFQWASASHENFTKLMMYYRNLVAEMRHRGFKTNCGDFLQAFEATHGRLENLAASEQWSFNVNQYSNDAYPPVLKPVDSWVFDRPEYFNQVRQMFAHSINHSDKVRWSNRSMPTWLKKAADDKYVAQYAAPANQAGADNAPKETTGFAELVFDSGYDTSNPMGFFAPANGRTSPVPTPAAGQAFAP